MTSPQPELDRFIDLMQLEQLDTDLYLGGPEGVVGARLYGGYVAAQAVSAVARTVAGASIHSLHAYFVRPGRQDVPIRYVVTRIRDGRSFTTRNVVAYQGGEAIFDMAASFVVPEEGFSYQEPMPETPGPDGLPNWAFVAGKGAMDEDPMAWQEGRPIEVRAADDPATMVHGSAPALHRVWMRPRGVMPEDPVLHAALLAYASDETTVLGSARPAISRGFGASLDHAVWFHYPPRWDDWLLYMGGGVAAYANRPLALCAMYSHDGRRITTVAQEELHRMARREG
jgi:acyl-CoA thioesterase-2